MIRLFCGYDEREAIGFHVFVASVMQHASQPVQIVALDSRGLPDVGSNAFTLSRFLVPWLCDFKGRAIFCDASDMLMCDDIARLDALFDPECAVQVVQHETYRTRHRIKYVGTSMQCPNLDYPRKNWASVMLMNCEHAAWAGVDPTWLSSDAMKPVQFLDLKWVQNIGALPDRWNRLVDEGRPVEGAALLHWTAGIPAFPHYHSAPGADLWRSQRDRMLEIP